jgi:hypothetical protein
MTRYNLTQIGLELDDDQSELLLYLDKVLES